MAVVLFLIYHGKSHFISSFRLARSIQHNHTVAFAGVEFFKGFVKGQGFTYYPLRSVPFGIGLDQWYNSVTNRKPVYRKTVADRWSDRLYHLRRKELTQLLLTCNPTHIIVDSLQATDIIVLHRIAASRGIKLALLHNMLPATYSAEALPLNSPLLPTDDRVIREEYRNERSNQWKQRWKQRFKLSGLSDKDIVDRRIRRNKIPKELLSDELSLFYPTLKGIPEFVMMDPAFDFNKHRHDHQYHFLGSQIDVDRRDTIDENFRTAQQKIQHSVANGRPLIYCSLGTLPPTNLPDVIRFLESVITATKTLDCILVISFQLNAEQKANLVGEHTHVYIFDSVPQLVVLDMASVFINHGGLNSIKESIEAEVPMLVCPAYATYDHHGNTARVVYHGLGLKADLNSDENEITEALRELLNNPSCKAQLKTFKASNAQYTLTPFIEFLQE